MTTIAYKALDSDFRCRGFQYRVGQTYRLDGEPVRCGTTGFHSCLNPLDVISYYPLLGSRFAIVEAGGEIARSDKDSKIASQEITISEELSLREFIDLCARSGPAHAVTQGGGAHAVAAGDYSHATTTGYGAHAVAAGPEASAVTVGDYSHAVAAGPEARAVTAGDYSHATTTGSCANAVAAGSEARAVTAGDYSHAVAAGPDARAVTAGHSAHAATAGERAHATTTGDGARAVAVGDYGHAAAAGPNSIAAALGRDGTVTAGPDGSAVILVGYDEDGRITTLFACLVGQHGIEPGLTYRLGVDGRPVLVEEEDNDRS